MSRTKLIAFLVTLAVCMPAGMALQGGWAENVGNTTMTTVRPVFGWVNDSGTGLPVQAAIYFGDMDGQGATNSTTSDALGFYSLNLSVTGIHHFRMHGINNAYRLNATDIWLDETIPWFQYDMELEPAPPRNCSVEGYLVDAVSGSPVSGENMTASSDDYLNSTATNATGYFRLGLISGEYLMGASRTGYESTSIQFTLGANQSKWRNITLEPLNCTLKGIVRGSGSPLTGAYVHVEEPWNVRPWNNDYENYTDAAGMYQMNLTRGTKNVNFAFDGFLSTSRPATLHAGVNWLNVTLAPVPANSCNVRGYIRDLETAGPLENAFVRIGNTNNSWSNGTSTNAMGFYSVSTIPGDLRIEAEHSSYLRNGTDFSILAGQTGWLNITMTDASAPPASMRGNITLDGSPVSEGRVNMQTWTDSYGVGTDGSGYYEIDVNAGFNEFSAMTSESGNRSNVESVARVLNPGETRWHDFDLHSIEFDSVVLGKARNQGGDIVEGALCYFSNSANGLSTYETAAVSDFNGTYEISLPMNEKAAYMYLFEGYLMQTGEFTPNLEWNWRNITLQTVGVQATIGGYLTDLEGNPIIGHQMTATAANWMNWTQTDSDGYFTLKVPRGDIHISSQLDSYYDPGRLLVKTGAGGMFWLNVSARPKPAVFEINGSVRESDSTPVPGAEITAMFGDRKFTATADSGGNYTLMVSQGQIDLIPRRQGYGTGQGYSLETNSWYGSLYWANLTLDSQAAWLELPVTESVQDADSDGKFDWLCVDVQVNVASSGEYTLEGTLFANEWGSESGGMSDSRVTAASNETALSAGLQTVRLAFNGNQISLSGIDGYSVDLGLRDHSWNQLDSLIVNLTGRNSADFDAPDIEPASPWHSFGPVDTDFDGLYNMLLFNTTVEVLAEGDYTIMAQLYNVPGVNDGEMSELDSEMLTRHMTAGVHTLNFAFSGTAIYNSRWHLGLASVVLFNSSAVIDETTIIGTSQVYTPYDYRQFQNYPIDSLVYGWANDTGGAPIENLRVEIYNTTNKYLNASYTDANGYYKLGGWGGSWILAMNDDHETSRACQGNLTLVNLTSGDQSMQNRIIHDQVLDTNDLLISFLNNDWNRTAVESVMGILADNETVRYEFDIHEFGNGDGFISEAEVDMLMTFLDSQMAMPADLSDHMTVDGITYDLDAGSETYDLGLVGSAASKEPIYIRQKANYTAQAAVPAAGPHDLNLNLSYDDTDMGSMSEGNSTMVSHIVPPAGWGRTGNKDTSNITFSGSDYITADPGTDPDTGDTFEYEWANITISDSQAPTVGSVAGNVTLDGRTEYFGVTVKVKMASTGATVTSTATDIYGHYTVAGIAPGTYNITAEKPGYQSNASNGHAVIAGAVTWIPDMTLFSHPPTIFNVHYLTTLTNETAIEIFADVTDDGEVGDVTLMYEDVFGAAHALPMSKLGGNTYRTLVPAQVGTGTVDFHIIANDTVGRSARYPAAGELTIDIVETVPPAFSNLAIANNPTEYGSSTNITVTVSDASALTGVWLYNHFTGTNITMLESAVPGNYYLQGTFLVLGFYPFTIWATDAFGNINRIDGSFTVQDSNAPAISDIAVDPASPEFLGTANITANITDLAGIAGVWLDMDYPNGTALGNFTMVHGAAASYYQSIDCDAAGQYHFTIWARDSHGRSSSATGAFWANDTVKPTIRNLTAPASVELGGEVNITADIYDLGGMASVTLRMYGPGHAEMFNETMNAGSYWYVFVPTSPGQHDFVIWAVDGNGVTNTTSSSFSVADTTPPDFLSVSIIPQLQEVHGSVNVRAVLDDLDSVASCHMNLTAPGGAWLSNTSMPLSGNTFSLNRTYSLLGIYRFTLWAADPSGNLMNYSGTINTQDTQAPTANAGIDRTVPMGTNVVFNASASTDNYGIANYTWTLTDNGVQTLYGIVMDYTFATVGVYDVTLTVTDHAGLSSSDIKIITVTGVMTTGTVTGTVLDGEGNPVPGVTVYVDNTAPLIQYVTDNTGYFILENVPQGEQTIWFVKDGYQRASRAVSVIVGTTVSAGTVTLSPSQEFSACAVLILIGLVIGAAVAYVIYKKRKAAKKAAETVIDEIFFMSTDGRLIKHFTRRLKPDMDQDILSGMLVAVQDFIKDSFRGEEGGLEELRFGKFQIVLGRGKHTIIAALILGDDTKPFKPQIEKCLNDIETNHKEALETWNGEVDRLTPSFRHINDLIAGKYA